jgi:hypothetical protein
VDITPLAGAGYESGKTFTVECDTLLLSVGLIPDTDLAKKIGIELNAATGGPAVDARLMTSLPGVFACGNGLHVHDLVDYATEEAERCGRFVSRFLESVASGVPAGVSGVRQVPVSTGANVRYVVPGKVLVDEENILYLRSLIVKNKASLEVKAGGTTLYSKTLLHVQPSEMISLALNREIISDGLVPEGSTVEVSIR